MKLLMITGDRSILRPGNQSAYSQLLAELVQHFERIDVICPRGIVDIREVRVLHERVFLHPSTKGRLAHPLFIQRKGQELFRAHQHDVMTVHEYPPFLHGIGAILLHRKTGIPMVMEMHHIVGWPVASSFSEFVGRWMMRLWIGRHSRFFDAVRVVNATVFRMLSDWGVESEKIRVVPSVYLDHALLHAAVNRVKKYDILFAARLVENKGLMEVIEAVASLPSLTLRIVGDGPLRPDAEAYVRSHGIEERVSFAGWIPSAEAYANAVAEGRVFVMNSRSEGNPRVAVEALALGLPVIATRVGIMPDILTEGENGWFTDGTPANLATMIDTALSNSQRLAEMSMSARKITDRFEKKKAVKAYADFLASVARF